MRSEAGQATVEWTSLVLLVALVLGALPAAGPEVDGRSFGGFLAHRLVCAVRGGCDDGDRALARAYGARDAALVRGHAPNVVYERGERSLPVDYRRCRSRSCSDAPDDRDLDSHRSDSGQRATVFARLIRRGGRTYVQYWLYYPDSNTSWAGSDKLWERSRLLPLLGRLARGSPEYPGFHHDDWEAYQLRIERDGTTRVRASSHGHDQGCKQRRCRNRWTRETGWTRVSRGSHAGHIPPELARERTTTAEGLRIVPLETLEKRSYRPLDEGIEPPWRKRVYGDPESDSS